MLDKMQGYAQDAERTWAGRKGTGRQTQQIVFPPGIGGASRDDIQVAVEHWMEPEGWTGR